MIEADNSGLPIGNQYAFRSISWSSFYYTLRGGAVMNLMLMRQVYEQFLERSFYGFCQITWYLRNKSLQRNEERMQRLMGLTLIYQNPDISKAAKGH